jgi:hypothetical protein
MSRKDFILIADTINREVEIAHANHEPIGAAAMESLARAMADKLATTNPRFDRARFLAACGIEGQRALI